MMGKIRSLNQEGNSIWLIAFGLIVLFIPTFFIVWNVVNYTHGIFMYPFDDTFIHLTIADNLGRGNWGINDNEFASASSSILYTLLLTLFRFFSKSPLLPFIINSIAGVIILVSLHFWLRKHLINYARQGVIFFLVTFFTPLPLLIVSGMEHTFQCLFTFLFVFYFSDWLEESNSSGGQKIPVKILVFGLLLSTIRYEGLFLIAIACGLLLFYRKFFAAATLALASLMPLVIFGLISVSKGNYFLPNSVLIKSGSFNYSSPLSIVYDILFEKLVYARNGMAALATQRLLIILPLPYLLLKRYLRPTYFFILALLFGAALLQLSFASTGYLYRYEAYLFFCFMIILPVIFFKYSKHVMEHLSSSLSKLIALVLTLFLFLPIILRSATALDKTTRACINIYDQQYQMASFIKQYYNQNTIALNDIGAVGYFTNSRIVDLWGLADIEVTKSKKKHYWSAAFLDSLCRVNHVKLSVIYESWFSDSLSKRWCKAATWQIQNNVICGDSVVSFYSLDTSSKQLLQEQLKAYEPKLPASVMVRYY